MIHSAQVIGTVPSKVLGPGAGGALVQADAANAVDVFLGAQYVTADALNTGGVRLAPGVVLPLVILGDDPLWAVVAAGTAVLRVIQSSDPGGGGVAFEPSEAG